MIRGKKIRKPLRKLKIQEKAEMEQELTPDFIDENEELSFQNVRASRRYRLCYWLYSLSRVPQATNLISRMSLDTLIVTVYRYCSIKERWMTW